MGISGERRRRDKRAEKEDKKEDEQDVKTHKPKGKQEPLANEELQIERRVRR